MNRIKIVIASAILAYRNPRIFQAGFLDLMITLFRIIEHANQSDNPVYTSIVVDTKSDPKALIGIWLSKGVTPVERAIELAKELKDLKEKYKVEE